MMHLRPLEELRVAIYLLTVATLCVASASTESDLLPPIPHLCDPIQCPADEEMQCPEDSSVREIREINAVNLLTSHAVSGGGGGSVGGASGSRSSSGVTGQRSAYNSSQMMDEVYAQCCLSKKCVCKTCYIPDCNSEEGEVVVELEPEAMETPGHCCGKYECKLEPNCTEVRDTDYYWLKSCQRCMCMSGARICEQSCDEGIKAICESKNLNKFFKDGDNWEDGCYQCECVRGEQKCVIPFCGHVNCPSERQVMLKDTCCPVCWPKGHPMPHEKPNSYDDGYGYDPDEPQTGRKPYDIDSDADPETELPLLPDNANAIAIATSTSASSTTNQPSSTQNADLIEYPPGSTRSTEATASSPPPSPSPCPTHDFPKVVEVVQQNGVPNNICFVVIGVLSVIIVGMFLRIRRLQAKQRSYRPVSNFDDKV